MYRYLFSYSLLLFCGYLAAQETLPSFDHSGITIKKIIRQDEAGQYFYSYNPERIAYLAKVDAYSKSYYKLFDQSNNLLAEGELYGSEKYGLWRNGKWIEYYPNGTVKISGNYYHGNEVGLWNRYYSNGQLKQSETITLVEINKESRYCLSGSYQEYYETGQLKVNGFYRVGLEPDTLYSYEEDKIGGEKKRRKIVQAPVGIRFGQWIYYKANGEIEKQEELSAPRKEERETWQYPDQMQPKKDGPPNERIRENN